MINCQKCHIQKQYLTYYIILYTDSLRIIVLRDIVLIAGELVWCIDDWRYMSQILRYWLGLVSATFGPAIRSISEILMVVSHYHSTMYVLWVLMLCMCDSTSKNIARGESLLKLCLVFVLWTNILERGVCIEHYRMIGKFGLILAKDSTFI